jgi:hypothetical protein
MKKGIAICAWAALLATRSVAGAQESPGAKPPEAENAPGKRLRVEFRETRQRGDATSTTRPYVLLLHADAEPARLCVGPQVTMTTSAEGTLTTVFKNTGIDVQAFREDAAPRRLPPGCEVRGQLGARIGARPGTPPTTRSSES